MQKKFKLNMQEKKIILENISKKFKIGFRKRQSTLYGLMSFVSGRESKKIIHALRDISFTVNSGEIVGIVGDNGSGKSTLLRVVAGIYKQDRGSLKIKGKIISLLNLVAGLKDKLTMRENIYLCSSLFGLSQKEIKKRFNYIVGFSELEIFTDTKIYQFSEGMKQRLSFSIAVYCDPDILLLDEVFEVGDKNFKEKSSSWIKNFAKNGGSVLLVSHDVSLIKEYCSRCIMMSNGKIIKMGSPAEVIKCLEIKI